LLQKAAMRLRDSGLHAGLLRAHARHRDDSSWSEEIRFNETQDTIALTHALNELWRRRLASAGDARKAPLRIGVMLARLLRADGHTPDLFEAERERRSGRLLGAVDEINRVLGKNAVYFGGAHGATSDAPMRIAFTRIPKPEVEEIDRERKGRFGRGGKGQGV
jgi:DNA polymerase-4